MEVTVIRSMCVACAFVVALCALSGSAAGQAGSNCIGRAGNFWWPGPMPPGWFNCISEGSWLMVCEVVTSQCPPAAAGGETRACPNCGAGKPISLASGNTYIEETDVRIPGLSGGLTLVRTWNSMWPSTQTASQVGLFGPNWRSNFDERVFLGSDNYIKYARGDGSYWSFGVGGPGWMVAAPANAGAALVWGPSKWIMTFPNGEQRLFDLTTGNLTSIIDRNGNTTTLAYDSINRLVTVTDPASRHLTFSYANGSSYLVTGVSSDVGLSLTYAYDTQGRLTQVTKPDQTTISFQYNSQSLITTVLDSNGKTLESHTYDSSGRGLSSSRAGGVESLTISYPN
jgi:YD repeat-containing protein